MVFSLTSHAARSVRRMRQGLMVGADSRELTAANRFVRLQGLTKVKACKGNNATKTSEHVRSLFGLVFLLIIALFPTTSLAQFQTESFSIEEEIAQLFPNDEERQLRIKNAFNDRVESELLKRLSEIDLSEIHERKGKLYLYSDSQNITNNTDIYSGYISVIITLTLTSIALALLWQSTRLKNASRDDQKSNEAKEDQESDTQSELPQNDGIQKYIPLWVGLSFALFVTLASAFAVYLYETRVYLHLSQGSIPRSLLEHPKLFAEALRFAILPPALFALYNFLCAFAYSRSSNGSMKFLIPSILGITASIASIFSSVIRIWETYTP